MALPQSSDPPYRDPQYLDRAYAIGIARRNPVTLNDRDVVEGCRGSPRMVPASGVTAGRRAAGRSLRVCWSARQAPLRRFRPFTKSTDVTRSKLIIRVVSPAPATKIIRCASSESRIHSGLGTLISRPSARKMLIGRNGFARTASRRFSTVIRYCPQFLLGGSPARWPSTARRTHSPCS